MGEATKRRHRWVRLQDGRISEFGNDGDDHYGPRCEVCGHSVNVCCDREAWKNINAGTYEEAADDWCDGPWARKWRFPAEPDVARLRCTCHGIEWRLRYAPPNGAWEPVTDEPTPESALLPWRVLLTLHEELAEVRPEREAWLAEGENGG